MIIIMLLRPRGLWPAPEHGKPAPIPVNTCGLRHAA
jgi:branched-chain amino acid transport system permease protein